MELRKRYYNGIQIIDVLNRHIDRPETIMNCLNDFSNLEVDDVEPVKHGHWIKIFEDEDSIQARCSARGMVYFLGKGRDPNYCGTCGADMREVGK